MSAPVQLLEGFPLAGTVAVEASAGTGKTHTITQVYLRLLLELGLRVEEILVVTFTNDATRELRERVRERVAEAIAAFEAGGSDDPFLGAVVRRHEAAGAGRRLRLAMVSFDQAAIFTIHGFCQRMLAEQAFACAQPFAVEVGPEPRELAQAVLDDLWRRETEQASPAWADFLVAAKQSPGTLLDAVWTWIDRPDVEVVAPEEPGDLDALESRCRAAWQAARERCARDIARVQAMLEAHPKLHRRRYPPEARAAFCREVARLLSAGEPRVSAPTPECVQRLAASRLAAAVTKGGAPLVHPFFDACQAIEDTTAALRQAFTRRLRRLRLRARETLARELRVRKARAGMQSYGDLLHRLAERLDGPCGEALAEVVRRRFRAAMIDEFQDTDPTQWTIFRRIFADGALPLVLVGDPKQAIYGFRGADVFTYVAARDSAACRWPLSRNWRSDAALVAGINGLFSRAPRPFLLDTIAFVPAEAARADDATALGDPGSPGPPLRLWFVPREAGERTVPKGEACESIARAVAAEIARLLAGAARGEVTVGTRPLRGDDIAVLVPTHARAALVRAALLRLGIGCVEHAQDSVFGTPEAAELERVLRAVAAPNADGTVRAALATELLGRSGEELATLADDERAWSSEIERFQGWLQLWRRRGFARMFRELLADAAVPARLLAFRDGERRLTNLLQLGELLHGESLRRRVALETLIGWMAERRRAERAETEEHQLRLESDAHLVQLVTVHASKGLEYGIVFCPFAWDGLQRVHEHDDLLFHDAARGDRPCLAFGPDHPADRLRRAREEEIAESLRLLYVALTRAKHRCTVVWGAMRDADASPLGWLLHPPAAGTAVDDLDGRFASIDDQALRADLHALAVAAPDALAVCDMPAGRGVPLAPDGGEAAALRARRLPRPVPDGWRVASFTTLVSDRTDEAPDHDVPPAQPGRHDPTATSDHPLAVPGSARLGSAVHEVFERHDFTSDDAAALESLVERRLRAHGLDVGWTAAVARMVERVLATPLTADGGVRLDRVASAQRLAELEFTCPLARLASTDVAALCRAHGFATGTVAESVDRLRFDPVAGYVRGFVDLVFEADRRWWLLDWKTNWLGPSLADYRADRLAAVIARDAYWLQYLIYTVVVHRLLRRRLPDYDYDRDFGGALYLFVRGIDPTLGAASGVYLHKAPRALIEALDARMCPARGVEVAC